MIEDCEEMISHEKRIHKLIQEFDITGEHDAKTHVGIGYHART